MNKRGGNPGNFKPLTTEEARARGAKGGSSPKRKATLNAKRIMTKVLNGKPYMSEELLAQLRSRGIDTQDDEMQTNAAILTLKVLQAAMGGDLEAIRMAFEMSGQIVTARDQTERERAKTEERRLKQLESESLGMNVPILLDYRPDDNDELKRSYNETDEQGE